MSTLTIPQDFVKNISKRINYLENTNNQWELNVLINICEGNENFKNILRCELKSEEDLQELSSVTFNDSLNSLKNSLKTHYQKDKVLNSRKLIILDILRYVKALRLILLKLVYHSDTFISLGFENANTIGDKILSVLPSDLPSVYLLELNLIESIGFFYNNQYIAVKTFLFANGINDNSRTAYTKLKFKKPVTIENSFLCSRFGIDVVEFIKIQTVIQFLLFSNNKNSLNILNGNFTNQLPKPVLFLNEPLGLQLATCKPTTKEKLLSSIYQMYEYYGNTMGISGIENIKQNVEQYLEKINDNVIFSN